MGNGQRYFLRTWKVLEAFYCSLSSLREPHTFHPREAFNGVTLKVTRPLKLQNGSFGISFNPFWVDVPFCFSSSFPSALLSNIQIYLGIEKYQ